MHTKPQPVAPRAGAAQANPYPPELPRLAPRPAALAALAAGAGGAGEDDADKGSDDSLDEAARNEGEYLRGRLRDELGREPTEAELDQWLRQHTEGY